MLLLAASSALIYFRGASSEFRLGKRVVAALYVATYEKAEWQPQLGHDVLGGQTLAEMDIVLPGDKSHHGHDVSQRTYDLNPCIMLPGGSCSETVYGCCKRKF